MKNSLILFGTIQLCSALAIGLFSLYVVYSKKPKDDKDLHIDTDTDANTDIQMENTLEINGLIEVVEEVEELFNFIAIDANSNKEKILEIIEETEKTTNKNDLHKLLNLKVEELENLTRQLNEIYSNIVEARNKLENLNNKA